MWNEIQTKYHFNLVENVNGKTLGYNPSSGVRLIEQDGFAFKDLARTGMLLPYEDWRLTPEERAEDLANRLNIEEIAGLMCFSIHQFSVSKELNDDQKRFLGQHLRSVLNSSAASTSDKDQIEWANSMQSYVEGIGFGIPCYISSDPRNGKGTSNWPGNLGLAATFDPTLAKTAAKCISRELRDLGIACFLAPQVDIACDPRWHRNDGTFGEDPALSRDMVRAFCDGLQSTYTNDGEDIGWGMDSVTAMAKHWTAEGASEGGREAHVDGGKYAVFPNNNFEALMIPFVDGAFKLDGKTGCAASVMSSYTAAWSDGSLGEVIGSSFSDYKINQLLRKRYGFEGPVCTDWAVLNVGKKEGMRSCGWGAHIEDEDVEPGERAFLAIMAGADQMGGCSNPDYLIDAYHFGCAKVGKEAMDKAFARSAKRLLIGYFMTGLFENPYIDEDRALADVNSADKQKAALDAQVKSVVMLKNKKHVIKKQDKRLKVYIPALYKAPFWELSPFLGIFDREAEVTYPISLEEASKYFDVVTDHVDGVSITRLTKEELNGVDLVLIPAYEPGNSNPQEGKTRDLKTYIPITRQYRPYIADSEYVRKVSISGDVYEDGTQQNRSYFGQSAICTNPEQLDQILDASKIANELGIPSIVAIFTGKPLCMHEFESEVDGILVTFSGCGEAICRIVAGIDEPSGLLPMQMPKDMVAVEKQFEDTPRDMECYTDSEGNVYDFAFGLNYNGAINDDRVRLYSVPALKEPFNKGNI